MTELASDTTVVIVVTTVAIAPTTLLVCVVFFSQRVRVCGRRRCFRGRWRRP
jgi:hypothetical protein